MAKGKVNTSDQSRKSKSTTRPSGLLTSHDVLVAKVRDDASVLQKAGFFVFWEEVPMKRKSDRATKIALRLNIVPPDGVELCVSGKGEIVLNGKVLE